MSLLCELSGKNGLAGNKVSHSNRKSKIRQLPNIKRRKFDVLGQMISINLCTRALRTINKHGGIVQAILKGNEADMSDRVLRLRRKIQKSLRG
ncbi:MAG: 50S ribosomal protein L28 [Deltaproteobacteria bacterium CG_4_10_14_0_2_um_filter_43_8]|nr:MAG: 50S ribosomal protein L28 [Deltaproteobacteria bacterium CG11_big_fil_rev_8_21_14_0_20_42_23]PJA20168.1 MAG: 50S ribosomal protein L28 [Deltaproteobacteria bacterium CG_4_10_14_0_2_um_filter_43_8]PJC64163.1 MAG: 50S ribosomal protein L28 [Deltaproteobacteria bacterium CG_4_9_14_0_2_um_filter_42_21]